MNRPVISSDLATRQIRTVTYLGLAINIVLSVVKSLIGLITGSMSLLADGIHSISDMVTDVVVLLGVRLSSKKPDHEHPYGHGRMETFSAAIVALVLVLVGGLMVYKACMGIARQNAHPSERSSTSISILIAAVVSVIAKEILYHITKRVAVKTGSSALYANAWHHRSDALSSIAVIVGYIATALGYDHGDHLAAIAVGLMIIMVAVSIVAGCLHEFAERAVDAGTLSTIEEVLASEDRIRQWHKLRTRSAGREIFMDLHILVDPALNISEAHEISDALEKTMQDRISRPVNITVHIEPDKPELRR
jgi:cation diffusion facilitator family transporter